MVYICTTLANNIADEKKFSMLILMVHKKQKAMLRTSMRIQRRINGKTKFMWPTMVETLKYWPTQLLQLTMGNHFESS